VGEKDLPLIRVYPVEGEAFQRTAPILTLLGIRGTAKKQPGSVPVSVS